MSLKSQKTRKSLFKKQPSKIIPKRYQIVTPPDLQNYGFRVKFSLFPGIPKIDPKSGPRGPQMAPKIGQKSTLDQIKNNTKKQLPKVAPIDPAKDLFPPKPPFTMS